MEYPETFGIHFARAVELFREPSAKEDQKQEFRSLMRMVEHAAARLVDAGDRLLVNDVAVTFPATQLLVQRLREHRIRAVVIEPAAKPADVFHLLRGLSGVAERPVTEYLAEVGATSVSVEAERRERKRVSTSAPAEPLELEGPAIPAVAELLQALHETPAGSRAPELLRALVVELEKAAEGEWIEHALTIALALVRLEPWGMDGDTRAYGIAMRAVLARPMLERYARAALTPERADAAIEVFRRAGGDGTRVLLELLAAAPTIQERRALFHALAHMSEGHLELIRALDDDRWYVVRNVADLCGELRLEKAVPKLGSLLDSSDPRVRRSAAFALAQIGSGQTTEFLRRALKDEVPDVRRQVPAGLEGRKNAAMAMPLAAVLEGETDSDVQREVLHALGRIGTPDAVRVLIKMAQPGGRIFHRRPTAVRLAAVAGLAGAASSAAIHALGSLSVDGDGEVRAAVERALRDLRGGAASSAEELATPA